MLVVTLALIAALQAGSPAAAPAPAQPTVGWPAAIVGTASLRLLRGGDQVTSHVTFSASAEPRALRAEVVRGGQLLAVLWCDADRLLVLVPGDPDVLHQAEATRANLEAALGLPFCPDELVFALRLGLAPPPTCGAGGEPPRVLRRGERIVGLERPDDPRRKLEFGGFARQDGRWWPKRALLSSPEGTAMLQFLLLAERPAAPTRPSGPPWSTAVAVDAATIARLLGVRSDADDGPAGSR